MGLKQSALKKVARKPVLLSLGIVFLAILGSFTYRRATLPRYGGQDIHYWWDQCIKPRQVTWLGWQDPVSVDATLHAFKGMGEKGATFVVRRYAESFEEPIYERFHKWVAVRARNKTNETL